MFRHKKSSAAVALMTSSVAAFKWGEVGDAAGKSVISFSQGTISHPLLAEMVDTPTGPYAYRLSETLETARKAAKGEAIAKTFVLKSQRIGQDDAAGFIGTDFSPRHRPPGPRPHKTITGASE